MNTSNTLAISHSTGEKSGTLSDQTIGAVLAAVVARQPRSLALVSRHQDIRLTYAELGNEVERVARSLLALGVEKGDRVGIWAPNCAEWTYVQFAAARVGAILVNVNPAYRAQEMAYAVNQSGLRLLITAPSFKASDYIDRIAEVRAELSSLERVVVIGERRTGEEGDLTWHEFLAAGEAIAPAAVREREEGLGCHDPINIQYTSGTTGNPKGATLTHYNILNNAKMIADTLGYTNADRVCIPVPLYHCFGMGVRNLGCVVSGATMVYPAPAFEPQATLEAIAEERCTSIYGVPTMFIAQLDHADFPTYDLTSLRTGIMAGAPCPIETMRRVISDMHAQDVCIAYGMTETAPVSFITRPTDSVERRVSTVGTVATDTEARVVDTETGATLPVGQPGEVCTRGYLVMSGYWQDPGATAAAVDAEGWMHTGDLGVMDEHGYLNIVGRSKDMVIRGGENLYPVEIEDVLFKHPAVASAQVIGVPDKLMGEELMAWVVLREGAAADEGEIRDFCRQNLAHFKVPRYVKFVPEYPLTVTGKVQKFRMRELAVHELGLEQAAAIRTA